MTKEKSMNSRVTAMKSKNFKFQKISSLLCLFQTMRTVSIKTVKRTTLKYWKRALQSSKCCYVHFGKWASCYCSFSAALNWKLVWETYTCYLSIAFLCIIFFFKKGTFLFLKKELESKDSIGEKVQPCKALKSHHWKFITLTGWSLKAF